MALYIITNKKNPNTNQLFQRACAARKISYREINTEAYQSHAAPTLRRGDLLYRVTVSHESINIERDLINHTVASLYHNTQDVISNNISSLSTIDQVGLFRKNNLPIPKTLLWPSPNNKELKKQVLKKLGEPPYVIKVNGGSQGIGVIRVDSLPSLFSVAAFLRSHKSDFMIREYIPVMKAGRVVVLGDKVIASMEFIAPKDDFRSNVLGATRRAKNFPKKIQRAAIDAVHTLGYEFGGVDVLINEKNMYIAEVNFPCVFIATTEVTAVDIAGTIIDYLQKKSLHL